MRTVKPGNFWTSREHTTMTVLELIECLQKIPSDTPVFATWEGQVRELEPKHIVLDDRFTDIPVVFFEVD